MCLDLINMKADAPFDDWIKRKRKEKKKHMRTCHRRDLGQKMAP